MRPSGRERNQLRPVKITRNYTEYAEGSVLIEIGNTRVLCNASVIPGVPRFIKGTGNGWITAEYSMLPRATVDRVPRDAVRGTPSGRTMEIQRLIGRAVRAVVDLTLLPEYTITLDCDVIQADGGTRTASITGAVVAMYDALQYMKRRDLVRKNPFLGLVGAISVGVYKDMPILDLDFQEDSKADTDMNIVMNAKKELIGIQGTAEKLAFNRPALLKMLDLAEHGIMELIQMQKDALGI